MLNHSLILGADSIFHFNRVYDTYMQFKTGNFNYFQSNYGFHQSGRIVNALYGPGITYLLGLLLLFVHSWIKFEIITSFFIYFISGYSMYFLSREMNSTKKISILTSILFMGSFYIIRWSSSQNFMTFGVMLLPLIVLTGLKMIKNNAKGLKVLPLALIVSLLIQIHVFSTLMSIGVLVVFFIVGFIKTNQKFSLLIKCFIASLLTLILTFNVWGAFLDVFTTNKLYPTVAYLNMSRSTFSININTQIGLIMSTIFILQIIWLFSKWSELNTSNRIVTILGIFFYILSSNLVPWTKLSTIIPQFQTLLQFPYRFYSFASILLLAGFGSTISSQNLQKNGKLFLIVGSIFILGQSYGEIQQKSELWNSENPIVARENIIVSDHVSNNQITKSFTSKDLVKGLNIVQKPTPDYLPANRGVSNRPYRDYKNEILMNKAHVKKIVKSDGSLVISWKAMTKGESISLPIVIYNHSTVNLNGNKLNPKKIKLLPMGSPVIKSTKIGENRLVLNYRSKIITKNRLVVVIASWIFIILATIIFTYKDKKNN
ncbi:MFS transporter [Dellaglioa sp. L3N]